MQRRWSILPTPAMLVVGCRGFAPRSVSEAVHEHMTARDAFTIGRSLPFIYSRPSRRNALHPDVISRSPVVARLLLRSHRRRVAERIDPTSSAALRKTALNIAAYARIRGEHLRRARPAGPLGLDECCSSIRS